MPKEPKESWELVEEISGLLEEVEVCKVHLPEGAATEIAKRVHAVLTTCTDQMKTVKETADELIKEEN